MKILLVGSGAREQAIAFKLKQSKHLAELYCWPQTVANRGLGGSIDLPPSSSVSAVAARALERGIRLVVVGPEGPLESGLADEMQKVGIPTFGPSQRAAQLEASKRFSKEVMRAAGIPTAASSVHADPKSCEFAAQAMLKRDGAVVLKASGLAAGKGVFVCFNQEDLKNGLYRLYETSMRSAAAEVLVEEFMRGREVSYFCTLGKRGVTPMAFAVDHKRLLDGDAGPNTGGMGCYTPVPWLPDNAEDLVLTQVIQPLIQYFASIGLEYTGWVYTGLMWTEQGPRVVEFNARLGDPEAEVLALADRSDWLEDILIQTGLMPIQPVQRLPLNAAVCVIMASSDYPYGESPLESCELPIKWLGMQADGVAVWAAAVKEGNDREHFATQRGRVLAVVGGGADILAARTGAYHQVHRIKEQWSTAHFRTDIGQSAGR
jgi:phosphoribosylamine--glycine ligase